MDLILFTHPSFISSQSMPRFAGLIKDGMTERGHTVQMWTPKAFFHKLPAPASLRKWLGYLDQFIVFPLQIKHRLRRIPKGTLFVFADQALGPWVAYLSHLPHVVHVHDFMALRSALGHFPENPISRSGKIYQGLIRRGFAKAENFISVSEKTRSDLHQFLPESPQRSEVVYNGVNPRFVPADPNAVRSALSKDLNIPLEGCYLLHVGGNQWYKNRPGVIRLYSVWREVYGHDTPLLLLGAPASEALREARETSPFRDDIHFVTGPSDETVRLAYAGAKVFLFPSLGEGFGWPIAEAMASGCPVITTDEVPMTEVAGESGFLIPRMPSILTEQETWAATSAPIIEQAWQLDDESLDECRRRGIEQALRFDQKAALDKIAEIYQEIIMSEIR